MLLESTEGRHLAAVLENKVVLLNPDGLDQYTPENICRVPGVVPALLRKAWFGKYNYVEDQNKKL